MEDCHSKEYWDQFRGQEPPIIDELLRAIKELLIASHNIYSDTQCGIEEGLANNLQHTCEVIYPMIPNEDLNEIEEKVNLD